MQSITHFCAYNPIPDACAAGLRVATNMRMRGFLGCIGFGPSQLGPSYNEQCHIPKGSCILQNVASNRLAGMSLVPHGTDLCRIPFRRLTSCLPKHNTDKLDDGASR